MSANSIKINNFTIFSNFKIDFCKGINILIGENGIGKTHLLKIIYHSILFEQQKIAMSKLKNPIYSNDYFHDYIYVFDIDKEHLQSLINNTEFLFNYDDENQQIENENIPPVFIPAKDMLSHAKGLIPMKKKYGENMPFDITLLNIYSKSVGGNIKVP